MKFEGPTIEDFHANHRGKTVSLWYTDQNLRMHQPQQKAYKNREREIKQTETKSLSFKLASIFENSDSGSDDSDIDFD